MRKGKRWTGEMPEWFTNPNAKRTVRYGDQKRSEDRTVTLSESELDRRKRLCEEHQESEWRKIEIAKELDRRLAEAGV